MKYELPKLPYGFDALEPYMDAQTVEIHYAKHHQTYTDKLNAVLEKYPDLQERNLEDLLKSLNTLVMEEKDRTALRNFGGGYANHNLFWEIMGPKKEQNRELIGRIEKTFGSIDKFKEQFSNTAANHFGSGYAWLVEDQNGKLEICSLPNQDSPLLMGHKPIITLDVWEHAYYLKYQNRRPEFIQNWWNVLKLL